MTHWFEIASRLASGAAAAIGVVVIVGWVADVAVLRVLPPGFHNMASYSAVCSVVAGGALVVAATGPRRRWKSTVLYIGGALVVAIAAIALAEHVLGTESGADRLLKHAKVHGGRMSVVSAGAFALLGSALLMTAASFYPRIRQLVISGLALVGLAMVLGHAYFSPVLPHMSHIPMRLPTGISLCLLSCAVLAAEPRQGWLAHVTSDTNAGATARRLLPAALLLPTVLGYLRFLGERRGLYGSNVGAALLVTGVLLLFVIVVLRSVAKLEGWERARLAAEQALRESEARFELAARAASDAIWDWNLATDSIWWNKGAETLFGHEPPPEGTAITWLSEHIHPDDRERVFTEARAVIREGRTFWRSEYRFRRADGCYAEVLDRGYLSRDPNGTATRMIGAMEDLSEAKRAEKALRESEKRFRAIFECTALGMAQIGLPEHRWIEVNAALCRMLGYTPEELCTTRCTDIMHPDDIAVDRGAFERMAAGQLDTYTVQKRLLRKDGQVVWTRLTYSLVRDHDGRPDYEIGVAEDISDQKQAEEALLASEVRERKAREALALANQDLECKVRARTAELEETIRELESFSYSLIHDLRAPLRAMDTYGSALVDDASYGLSTEGKDYVRRIKAAVQRMDHLITDSLNYSKVMRNELELGEVELGKLLRDLTETYPNLQPPHAEVTVEISDLSVQANEAALTQVFSNLLGNAVKFVAQGVKPRVRVWAEDLTSPAGAAPRVMVWVEDNGIGIPKEGRERIFEMFQRMHRAEEYPGTGIGLAIVRKSLERIGGRVQVESEPGKGSRFGVELPRFIGSTAEASA